MDITMFTEDALIEQPAIRLLKGVLGWQTVNAYEETFGAAGTLGRENRGEYLHAHIRDLFDVHQLADRKDRRYLSIFQVSFLLTERRPVNIASICVLLYHYF